MSNMPPDSEGAAQTAANYSQTIRNAQNNDLIQGSPSFTPSEYEEMDRIAQALGNPNTPADQVPLLQARFQDIYFHREVIP
jgi:hypothetical protein